jgi:hypothetical protein
VRPLIVHVRNSGYARQYLAVCVPFGRWARTRYAVTADPFAAEAPRKNLTFPEPRFVIDVNVGAEGFALVTVKAPTESFGPVRLLPIALNAPPEMSYATPAVSPLIVHEVNAVEHEDTRVVVPTR